ncbi:MAG TPA: SANT/Myb-like DNA-binding domain-containing protein [Actinomycetota bacterium]|nr:SANT/Myb-like DNA-binding domain-containing protein [Actinomycetota bacterium]
MSADPRGRLARNDESRNKAEHHAEPWSQYEDEFLAEMWGEPGSATHTEGNLAEIAEALGRTIEACRERYYKVRRATTVTYTTRTRTERAGYSEEVTTTVERKRPAWMDEEGLPDWYV